MDDKIKEVEEYLNIWYSSADELLKYIEPSSISNKNILSILQSGPMITTLSKKDRKKLETDVDDKYMLFIENNLKEIEK